MERDNPSLDICPAICLSLDICSAMAPLTLGICFSFLVIAPVDLRIKWRHPERFGQDTMINLEQAGALLIIPIISLVATIGTSWAFYVWSQGLRRTAGDTCGSAFGCMSN